MRDGFEIETIVVDDGSTDGSYEELRDMKGVILERHERNQGKRAAVATGARKATGEAIVIQDAEYDPKEIALRESDIQPIR